MALDALLDPQSLVPFVGSLRRSIFSSWGSVLLVLMGFSTIGVGIVAFVQTRTWPRAVAAPQADDDDEPEDATEAAAPAEPKRADRVARPATTTDTIRITFPDIADHHPDVWDDAMPLRVAVRVRSGDTSNEHDGASIVTLVAQTNGERRNFGSVAVDGEGIAWFDLTLGRRGEVDLVASLKINDEARGQAVRAVRLVDYRAEVIETFEDFVTWAANQFGFIDRKRTAREFVDMFVDGKPGTPAAPLDEIVDIYEIANFSDHAVDRTTYLRLVDAFLVLEESGALEGSEAQ